ncbi:hypothetical protein N7474_010655 [Penicillium riverlandense]|uniref:uncharacterized protein n=1 Tax=Penicillium riverlandense TaxID=1903569 RepID=UPI00254681C1|nr:uncharacterized protein N7474_010655 [Penicillium riverlandense]KAJ5807063.1 hypothetical protein N7474_010655 [Penicillium riverlandense]
MGGFVLESPELHDFPLNSESLRILVTDGSLEIPDMEETVIKDRSKVDAFARAFAVLQGFWTIVQCLARYEEGLPVTALEVNAVLFTVISLWTYGFQWCKPKDVCVPIKLVYPKKLDVRTIE